MPEPDVDGYYADAVKREEERQRTLADLAVGADERRKTSGVPDDLDALARTT